MLPQELAKNPIWLQGPEWLSRQLDPTEREPAEMPRECLLEEKKSSHALMTISKGERGVGTLIDVNKYSGLKKLLRVTAQVLRFTSISRRRRQGLVEAQEKARILWLQEAQSELNSDPNLETWKRQLNVTLGEDNLWRCTGRMENSDLNPEARSPVLLGRRHHLVKLLIREAHHRVMHNGCKETLTELRGRQVVRREINQCPVCRRFEGRPCKSIPPPQLPVFRVQQARPFTSTGIDFAGPLYVRDQEDAKVWLCLYTCCVSRAVHLELVPSLSTEAFIRSFRRFCSRRGTPSLLVTDNAQIFRAADQTIQDFLNTPELREQMEGRSIQWKFIVEKAPWQGGIFERMVKAAKRCLRKVIGRHTLTYDELQTLITEVEATLNSRPLSYVSPDDLEEPLTPSHLITGHRILSLPEPAMGEDPDDHTYQPTRERLTRRMKHLAELQHKFWTRWKREYLQELREHHRWSKTTRGTSGYLSEGTPVIIMTRTSPGGCGDWGRCRSSSEVQTKESEQPEY